MSWLRGSPSGQLRLLHPLRAMASSLRGLRLQGQGMAAVAQPVGAWVGSRVALAGFVLAASWLVGIDRARLASDPGMWFLQRFTYWDSLHFLRIAEQGYFPPHLACCDQAFFPGYPLLVAGVAPLTGGTMVAALVVSLLAGIGSAALLWRLAADTGGRRMAACAVLFLIVAPYGIFLSAAYSESTFLVFVLAAWLAGTKRHWWWAGIFAGAAAGVRVNGLFLALALAVMYVAQLRSQGRWRPRWDAAALLVPFAVTGAYFAYLFASTGSLDAWHRAEAAGWRRQTVWPWQAFSAAWHAIVSTSKPDLVLSRWADLLTVVAGVVLVLVLTALRRWPEVVYVGLSVGVLLCSNMFTSAPRYALVWFPGYLVAAQLATRPGWNWLRVAIPALCLPLTFALALAFSARQWVS